ncbi:MAG TPA: hypothetical protein PLV39_14715 [Fimbriimonadaceae bacterium]|jgi:hypothetical protein|nr:hypothetical protein [Fimbriimonadaceae bacterium]
MKSRFIVLAAQRRWVVVDRQGDTLCLTQFASKRHALRLAALLEREYAREGVPA